jgi:hypothetical protein
VPEKSSVPLIGSGPWSVDDSAGCRILPLHLAATAILESTIINHEKGRSRIVYLGPIWKPRVGLENVREGLLAEVKAIHYYNRACEDKTVLFVSSAKTAGFLFIIFVDKA